MNITTAIEALVSIRDLAMDHPSFSRYHFDRHDVEGIAKIGGDLCDWTMIAILADDVIKDSNHTTP